MLINPVIFIALIWLHFIGDFIFQTDWMAKNKNRSNYALCVHSAVYSAVFFMFGWQFMLITFVTHYFTDWWSSRISSSFWQKGDTHWFFVVVGFDQAIHITTLLVTFMYLAGG